MTDNLLSLASAGGDTILACSNENGEYLEHGEPVKLMRLIEGALVFRYRYPRLDVIPLNSAVSRRRWLVRHAGDQPHTDRDIRRRSIEIGGGIDRR